MAKNPKFNNFTDETIKRLYMVHELLANQIANPYGIEVKDKVTIVDKKENASA